LGLLRIVRRGPDFGRKVSRSAYIVARENLGAEGLDVEPLVRRAFETAIVEIEPVYVNAGPYGHVNSSIKAETAQAAVSGPAPEGPGVVTYIIAHMVELSRAL
jgi:hypothetical protein